MSAGKKFATFKEFWPEYLRLHSKPVTRAVHYVGTALGLAAAATGIVTATPLLIAASPFIIYGILFPSHFIFEKNQPATIKNPLMSVGGDFKMFFCWMTGRLKGEFRKHGLDYTGRTGDNRNDAGAPRVETAKKSAVPAKGLLARLFNKKKAQAATDTTAKPNAAPKP